MNVMEGLVSCGGLNRPHAALQQAGKGVFGAADCRGILQQAPVEIQAEHDGLHLEGELLRVEIGAEMAFLRSEEHTSELQSLMRISYAVFRLKKKNKPPIN